MRLQKSHDFSVFDASERPSILSHLSSLCANSDKRKKLRPGWPDVSGEDDPESDVDWEDYEEESVQNYGRVRRLINSQG